MTTEEALGLIILLLIATFTAQISSKKGFDWRAWFFWTMLFGPIATLIVYFRKPKRARRKMPSMIKVDGLWFYLDEKQKQAGPVSSYKIQEMLQKEYLSKDSYVWSEGMKNWEQLQNTPLNKIFIE